MKGGAASIVPSVCLLFIGRLFSGALLPPSSPLSPRKNTTAMTLPRRETTTTRHQFYPAAAAAKQKNVSRSASHPTRDASSDLRFCGPKSQQATPPSSKPFPTPTAFRKIFIYFSTIRNWKATNSILSHFCQRHPVFFRYFWKLRKYI